MQPIFRGSVKKGKLILDDPAKYLVHLASFEGQRIELVLRKQWKQRSVNENNYYRGVVIELLFKHLESTGHTRDEIHEICKFKFLKQFSIDGLEYVKSTTKLSTIEMEEYIENIRRWGALLGCYIPLPNEGEMVNYE